MFWGFLTFGLCIASFGRQHCAFPEQVLHKGAALEVYHRPYGQRGLSILVGCDRWCSQAIQSWFFSRTFMSGTLSFQDIPSILRRDLIWNCSSDRRWCWYSVHVSLPYNREVRTIALYTCTFVFSEMFLFWKTLLRSLPNAQFACWSLKWISSSRWQFAEIWLPKYLKQFTSFRGKQSYNCNNNGILLHPAKSEKENKHVRNET